MRILGIDFGTKKVGLALTDEAGKMAFPHTVVPNDASLLTTVVELIQENNITAVVMGHSLNLDGTPNAVQTDVESFIADLTLQVPIPIHLEPEQLTSKQAAVITGKNDQIDAAAAAIILDTWLQKQGSTDVSSEPEQKENTKDETPEISFDDFMKVHIKIGTIVAVEIVPDADKLLKLTVDLGEAEPRQIVSGIREYFEDEQTLVGRQSPFVTNLAPRTIRGLVSQGMILAAGEDTFALLSPDTLLVPGTAAC